MNEITLGFDWLGPLGFWPNGLSFDYLINKDAKEKSFYSIGNNTHPYDLESYRHPYTYSKLSYLLDQNFKINYRTVYGIEQKYIYEITPLLKPYQWINGAFDNISQKVKLDCNTGKCLIVINDMNEGYGVSNTDFFSNLNLELEKSGINPSSVVYITMNSIIDDLQKKWNTNSVETFKVFSVYLYEHLYENNYAFEKTKHYISLNRSPNRHRICLIYELWKRDLIKYGYVSFPSPDQKLDYQIEKMVLADYNIDDSRWEEFISQLPFIVDTSDFTVQDCYNFSIHDYYKKSIFSIVSEQTFNEEECIKFSEKTFMPISNGCLPLFLYSPNTVSVMKQKLGYETLFFDYDSIIDEKQRFWEVVNTIEYICSVDIDILKQMSYCTIEKNLSLLKDRNNNSSGKKEFIEFINKWMQS